MPPNEVWPPAGNQGPEEETAAHTTRSADVILSRIAEIESAYQAYVVLVITPAGKYRRRVMLSLHGATAAVQRAQAKGQTAHLVLCRLVPVQADPELGSGWSE
jgi:hypothetical protein